MSNYDDDDRYRGKKHCMLHRRDLFKGLLGAGAVAGITALPWMRNAFAQRRPDATAKRVLVLYFSGGVRSSVAFHASPATKKYNPWGAITDTPRPTPFSLGKLLDDFIPAGTPIITPEMPLPDSAYTLRADGPWAGMRTRRLREIAPEFSVVGTWNTSRGDHYRASIEESTGSPTGTEAGLLSRIATGVDAAGGIPLPVDNAPMDGGTDMDAGMNGPDANTSTDGGTDGGSAMPPRVDPRDQVPAFHVQPGSNFGHTTEATARFTPVPLFGVGGLPGRGDIDRNEARLVGRDWARDAEMRARLDQRRLRARTGWGHGIVDTYAGDREARRRVGERLTAPWIDPSRDNDEARGAVMTDAGLKPLSNAMMRELFLLALGPDPNNQMMGPYDNPGASEFGRTAMDVALAIRLLQLGSPAIAVEMGGFDTHSGERRDAPARFRFVGRLWATLHFLLSRMPEPGEPGKTMLDRTLIITMSEMGRDPGTEATGFNNGEGSDHGADPSCYYIAHGIMGGGVIPNRFAGPAPATTYTPAMADRISLRRLHATALWAMGLEYDNPDWGFPDVQPITQLFTP